MRMDPTTQKKATGVKAVPWDNQELRNRLQGQQVETNGLSELQSIARDRTGTDEDGSRRRRDRRRAAK